MKKIKENKYKILSTIARYRFVFIIGMAIALPMFFVNADVVLNTTLDNPLGGGIEDIPTFIEKILDVVLVVGIPVVALAIIYTGFLFVKAQGNSEDLTKAKKTLLYTIVGAVLLLGAFVIAKAIKGTVDDIKSTT